MDMCAIGTGKEALKSDIRAEVKSDMSTIRADRINQVHVMENKMGNCVSAIMQLKTQISDSCADKAELEERLDKQHKNVISMVEQQTTNL
jgi:ribonuclease HII